MCNLYSMTRSREAVLRLFLIADNRAGEIKPQSSIFPAYTAPIVTKADDGERELVPMSWGFVLLQFRPQYSEARSYSCDEDRTNLNRSQILRFFGIPPPNSNHLSL